MAGQVDKGLGTIASPFCSLCDQVGEISIAKHSHACECASTSMRKVELSCWIPNDGQVYTVVGLVPEPGSLESFATALQIGNVIRNHVLYVVNQNCHLLAYVSVL